MSRGGRRYGRPHLPVESCHSLSSWGYFQYAQMWCNGDDEFEWQFSDDAVVLRFSLDGTDWSQTIRLTFAPCRFGGRRGWFACPYCGLRVGKVYLPCTMYSDGARVHTFACRHCYSLTYLQRQDRDRYWVYLYRADRIEARWLGEVTDGFVYKRKGQHWSTFNKRFEQHQALIGHSNAEFFSHIPAPLKRAMEKAASGRR